MVIISLIITEIEFSLVLKHLINKGIIHDSFNYYYKYYYYIFSSIIILLNVKVFEFFSREE